MRCILLGVANADAAFADLLHKCRAGDSSDFRSPPKRNLAPRIQTHCQLQSRLLGSQMERFDICVWQLNDHGWTIFAMPTTPPHPLLLVIR